MRSRSRRREAIHDTLCCGIADGKRRILSLFFAFSVETQSSASNNDEQRWNDNWSNPSRTLQSTDDRQRCRQRYLGFVVRYVVSTRFPFRIFVTCFSSVVFVLTFPILSIRLLLSFSRRYSLSSSRDPTEPVNDIHTISRIQNIYLFSRRVVVVGCVFVDVFVLMDSFVWILMLQSGLYTALQQQRQTHDCTDQWRCVNWWMAKWEWTEWCRSTCG